MRSLAIVFALSLAGCEMNPASLWDDTELVLKGPRVPDESAPTPEGFHISPKQAYEEVADCLGYVHSWRMYADNQNYYFLDMRKILFATSVTARKSYYKVDGKTGLFEYCFSRESEKPVVMRTLEDVDHEMSPYVKGIDWEDTSDVDLSKTYERPTLIRKPDSSGFIGLGIDALIYFH